MRAIPWRITTVRAARQPSIVFCPATDKDVRDVFEGCGAGMVGTTVERTTYGQYDRCSRSTSSWRRCGCLVVSDVAVPLVCGGEMKAHRPTRRWHNTQCRRVASGFAGKGLGARLALWPSTLARVGAPGVGVPSRRETTDAAREGGRAGVASATEVARDNDCVRDRSAGGAGGTIDHPNNAVITAVSVGRGSACASSSSEPTGESVSELGTAKVRTRTLAIVESSDCTWVDVCHVRQESVYGMAEGTHHWVLDLDCLNYGV